MGWEQVELKWIWNEHSQYPAWWSDGLDHPIQMYVGVGREAVLGGSQSLSSSIRPSGENPLESEIKAEN